MPKYSCDPISNAVVECPLIESERTPSNKSVRISEDTFYFGSNQSDSSNRITISGKDSVDSTYFSSFASDGNENPENSELYKGKINLLQCFLESYFPIIRPWLMWWNLMNFYHILPYAYILCVA